MRLTHPPIKPLVISATGVVVVAAVLAAVLWWPRGDGDGVHLDAGSAPPTTVGPAISLAAPAVAGPSTVPGLPTLPTSATSVPSADVRADASVTTVAPAAPTASATSSSVGPPQASGTSAGTTPGSQSGGPGATSGSAPTGTAPTAPTSAPTTAAPATAATGGSSWQPGQRVFVSSSSWNTPIPSGARFTDLPMPAASGGNYWVDWEEYSVAVWVAQPGDPVVSVSHPSGWGFPANSAKFRLRSGVGGANGTDGSVVVVDGGRVYNLWQFRRTGDTTATASAAASTDALSGTGWGTKAATPMGAGITAVGSSQLAGLLMQADVDAGEIRHALQMSVDRSLNRPGAVGEALRSDGSSSSGIVHQGQRLAIPPSVPMPSGLSPLGQKVFRALQTYGAFDVDSSGGSTTLRAQSNAFDAATIDALRKDMKSLGPLLEAVDW